MRDWELLGLRRGKPNSSKKLSAGIPSPSPTLQPKKGSIQIPMSPYCFIQVLKSGIDLRKESIIRN
jgi:hypothetical protein